MFPTIAQNNLTDRAQELVTYIRQLRSEGVINLQLSVLANAVQIAIAEVENELSTTLLAIENSESETLKQLDLSSKL